MEEDSVVKRIRVRATVNLSGLHLGERAWVDPSDPYIAEQLERRHLVPDSLLVVDPED